MLVLRAPQGGYDHSSGSTPEGKKTGASHFLIHGTAVRLAEAGCTGFNLGGARADESGLRDFKLRFGAREVALHAIRLDLQSRLRRTVGGLLRKLGAVR
jgi:lipid II:glycine glycyltransferase (peptidoglycan interpeptide bridge formation enzyme)